MDNVTKIPSKESTSLSDGLQNFFSKDIKLFRDRFTDQRKESLYLEMATLIAAGLDIKSTLDLLEKEQPKPALSAGIGQIKNDLIKGMSLWEAFKRHPDFTPYEYYSIQIGEETGKLVAVLEQLYQYYQKRLKQKRQLISALSYPSIIVATSVGAVSFMMLFIVPMFKDIFSRFGGDLPWITSTIISIATLFRDYFLLAVVMIISLIGYLYTQRQKIWFQVYSAKLVFKLPVLGDIIHSVHMARFCSSMALLLSARVPLIRTLALMKQMVSYYPIHVTLDQISQDVLNGISLHTSMGKHTVYERKMVTLLKVGEEVNKLDAFFYKMADQYGSNVEHKTGLLNTFLEPAMIIFLGIIVGFILLAMYLPMFQMSTTISG
jgi:type IV pilus assembly protein PilC